MLCQQLGLGRNGPRPGLPGPHSLLKAERHSCPAAQTRTTEAREKEVTGPRSHRSKWEGQCLGPGALSNCRALHSPRSPAFPRTRGGSRFAEAGTSINGVSKHRCARPSVLGSSPLAFGPCHLRAFTEAVPSWETLLSPHLSKLSSPLHVTQTTFLGVASPRCLPGWAPLQAEALIQRRPA